jgi:FtsH-binding integral membrane protein
LRPGGAGAGDPDYDAFLREVQRLADEREAAEVASGTSTKMRRAVGLFASVLVATIGLALVVAVLLGVFGQSAIGLGLAVVGLIGLLTGLISFARIARSAPDGGDSRLGG